MAATTTMSILTLEQLLEANEVAEKGDYSAYCNQQVLKNALIVGAVYPIVSSAFDHTGRLVCGIAISPYDTVYIALDQSRVNLLAMVQVDMAVVEALADSQLSTRH